MTLHILGLDLSLTATGACLVPVDWEGDWGRVRSLVTGFSRPKKGPIAEQAMADDWATWDAERSWSIAANVARFGLSDFRCSAVACYVESAHVGLNTASAMKLSALRGWVECELVRSSIFPVRGVQPSSHYKLLSGGGGGGRQVYGPRVNVKNRTRQALLAAGAPQEWSEDQMDAFSVANYGLSLHGGLFFGVPKVTG